MCARRLGPTPARAFIIDANRIEVPRRGPRPVTPVADAPPAAQPCPARDASPHLLDPLCSVCQLRDMLAQAHTLGAFERTLARSTEGRRAKFEGGVARKSGAGSA